MKLQDGSRARGGIVSGSRGDWSSAESGRGDGRGHGALRWLVAVVVVAKAGSLALSWGGNDVATAASSGEASAAPSLAVVPPARASAPAATGAGRHVEAEATTPTASGADVKHMLEALARRQGELDQREKTLAAREEKLALYEKDVTEKIARLEEVGKTLKEELRRSTAASDEAAQSLAKVYGAMKPAEAAPLLDQLDEGTALRILTRMKEKQVGEILPLMNRERAIVLTRSLAGRVVAPAAPPRG